MKPKISAEEWEERLNAIVRKYRLAAAQDGIDLTDLLAKAIRDLCDLGLTQGEAVKYLKPHLKGT